MARRFAAGVVRARFVIIAIWIAAATVSVFALPTIRDAHSGALGDLVPVDAQAIDAEKRSAELFAFPLLSRTLVVVRDPERLSGRTLAVTGRLVAELNRHTIAPLGWIGGVYVLANVTGSARFARERFTTIVLALLFRPEVRAPDRTAQAEGMAQRISAGAPRVSTGVTGALSARDQQAELVSDRLPLTELVTLAFVVLAVALYTRSLVAPLVNLAAVAVAYLVSIRVVAAIGEQIGVAVPSEVEPVIVALLFGVVTDYVLFSLSRFRRQLALGHDGPTAARIAFPELTPILTACGLAVAAGCGALIVAQLGFLRAFGPGVALSVLVGLLVALTFVPACFALLGRATIWPARLAARDPHDVQRSERLVRLVVERPLPAIAVTLGILGACSAGLGWIALGNPLIRGLPADSSARQASEQAARGLAPGAVSPTVVIVEQPGLTRRRSSWPGCSDRWTADAATPRYTVARPIDGSATSTSCYRGRATRPATCWICPMTRLAGRPSGVSGSFARSCHDFCARRG